MSGKTDDAAFRARIQALLPEATLVEAGSGETASAAKGAYALLIHLDVAVPFARRGTTQLIAPGCYVYAGSANGQGGIRARLRHHLRREKRPHWHVDHLTNAAQRVEALTLPGGSECAIVARLGEALGPKTPVAGFGSSDCRVCASHLLRWAEQD
jgi:Uri superfamily endonuclease